jgi:fumarate reductase flavoprotein subunit
MLERHDTDILILGAGGAGLFAALHAQQAAPDLKVTIAVKGLLGKCGCTRMVQGGYNVALGPGDTVERHFMDTIEGGKWLPDQDIAWRLCETAVTRVRELENEVGCFFDRNPDGSLHHKAFAGQTADRTVHKGDLTGIEIISRLMEQVLARPVRRLEEHRAVGLIPAKGGEGLAGVLFVDIRSGHFRFVRAKAVLLATGGGPTIIVSPRSSIAPPPESSRFSRQPSWARLGRKTCQLPRTLSTAPSSPLCTKLRTSCTSGR